MGDVGAALAEETVHEGGLPMVDVGYHGDVPELARVERALGSSGGRGGGSGGGESAEGRRRGVGKGPEREGDRG